jgi:hypothetical protein
MTNRKTQDKLCGLGSPFPWIDSAYRGAIELAASGVVSGGVVRNKELYGQNNITIAQGERLIA